MLLCKTIRIMAKRKSYEQHEKDIVALIKRVNTIVYFENITNHYPDLGKTTMYAMKLNESNAIKEALEANRNYHKETLFSKWVDSDNATLQVAAFRYIGTEEDRRRLNQQYVEATGKGGAPLMAREVAPTDARKIIDSLKNESMTE